LVSKPKRWYYNKKERKLTKGAKAYLSFKLKSYWKKRKASKEEVIERYERPPKADTIIRVWVKWQYPSTRKPLYIEAFIEGYYRDYNALLQLLESEIKRAFGSYVAERVEMGAETGVVKQGRFTTKKEVPVIYYKSSLKSSWRRLR
jgi:hypothetical protein